MSLTRVSRLLLDTNVWLDYYLDARGRGREATALVEACVSNDISLLYAPTSAKDLFYLIPRRLRQLEPGGRGGDVSFAPAAWACVSHMMELAVAAPQSQAECAVARLMRDRFDDFEDSLVVASADAAGADFVVTGDRQLLRAMPEACVTPARALQLLMGQRGTSRSGD